MSSQEEDKNKQTNKQIHPRQERRNKRREDRELSKQRAEAKSPKVGQLQLLGRKSRLTVVSPELPYAEKLKGGNISEPKDKKEEEEGDREGRRLGRRR